MHQRAPRLRPGTRSRFEHTPQLERGAFHYGASDVRLAEADFISQQVASDTLL